MTKYYLRGVYKASELFPLLDLLAERLGDVPIKDLRIVRD